MSSMRAVVQHSFGGPDVLRVEEAPRPEPLPTEVLVRVRAAGVNPVDWKTRAGTGMAGVLGEELPGEPAWRTLPSWALVSTRDRSLPPEILRYMAERAGSQVVEAESSHAAPLARPSAVTDLILAAVRAVTPTAVSH